MEKIVSCSLPLSQAEEMEEAAQKKKICHSALYKRRTLLEKSTVHLTKGKDKKNWVTTERAELKHRKEAHLPGK